MTKEGMENLIRTLVCAGAIVAGASVVSACDEGPLEEAGESIDEAAEEVDQEL